ncbi:membrane protein insertase YidC [Leucobacter sp. OH1287]|uniref:membrane protein insertase YidC n=1 Tax=Leucobacter sp. OH1287 TaxID=2491049 RepID=UPI000F5DC491|nr:membrane protein insertase YidC [Leucobacter sp. OH1287]RRD60360.1 membrane protein insertase YidC [Leucobacter sp. OH1287]
MYEFFQTIFWPLRWLVEAVLALWHNLFEFLGMDPDSGLTWLLAIIGVVIVVRSAIIPLTVRQIKSQRKMMEVAPEMRKIQAKYKGKNDQFSREAMQREMMGLYKKHGTSPFASCLPILVQMPIFFSMYFVLRAAAEGSVGVGLMTERLTNSFNNAVLFGAPIRMNFGEGWESQNWAVTAFLGAIMILMVASQFFTQKQIMSKNVSDETKASPMYRQQQILLYIIPFAFLFSGFVFPLALNLYWFASNLWTMGQQAIVINKMPTPGSEAWRARQARLLAKGKLSEDEARAVESAQASQERQGQRQQPMSAKRAKRKGGNK